MFHCLIARYIVARVSTFSICWPGPIVAAERRGGEASVVAEVGISWIGVERVAHRCRLRHGVGPDDDAVAALNLGAGPVPVVIGTVAGLNEHTGEGNTVGVMALHDKVTFPL